MLDGTPAHAPLGVLTYGADGRIACHLCGNWFTHLGAHLRQHGWTAAQYREAAGLPRRLPLCCVELSRAISVRQRRRVRVDPRTRDALAIGQQLARTGELTRQAILASRSDDRRGLTSGGRAKQRACLDQGRVTAERRRAEQLERVISAAGVPDLHTLLANAYADGASLESLAKLTGLGRSRLRAAVLGAGIAIRPTGWNSQAGKQRRASEFDARTAARVGASDIRTWLREQRALGRKLAALAQETGRSEPWIRLRLAR